MEVTHSNNAMTLAGVDLAWRPDRNGTGIAIGTLQGNTLFVEHVHSGVKTLENILKIIEDARTVTGVAVDAPLIINNVTGKRDCERELTRIYGRRKAGCHSSNLSLYPDPATVAFSDRLTEQGFQHLGRDSHRWQIECYPHPAIIEMFGLPERLAYKKGNVKQKRGGQIRLAQLLLDSERNRSLSMRIPEKLTELLNPDAIAARRGQALKDNEDALDAIVSLMIAAHYALETSSATFGSIQTGYIYVPTPNIAPQRASQENNNDNASKQ